MKYLKITFNILESFIILIEGMMIIAGLCMLIVQMGGFYNFGRCLINNLF